MPLPKPGSGESRDEFISRCMSDLSDEFSDQDQRMAVCQVQWENRVKMQSRILNRPLEIKEISEKGEFSGYASIFGNVDSYLDKVEPGAFEETLSDYRSKGRLPPFLWQHDTSKPLGKFTLMEEDSVGLKVEGVFALKTRQGGEAYELVSMGALDGMSIGYYSKKWSYDEESDIRSLVEVELLEASLVTLPANDEARLVDVKSRVESLKELKDVEKVLRDAGFSRSECKALVSCVKSISLRDAEEDIKSAARIQAFAAKLRS